MANSTMEMDYQEQVDWSLNCFKKMEVDMKRCIADGYSEASIKTVKTHIKGVYISSGWRSVGTTLKPSEFLLAITPVEDLFLPTPIVRIEGYCSRGVLGDRPSLIFNPVVETPECEFYSHGHGDSITLDLSENDEFILSQISRLFGFDQINETEPIDPQKLENFKNRIKNQSGEENPKQELDWPWPILDVPQGKGKSAFAANFADVSALKLLGYSVGKNGLSVEDRKELLEQFLTGPLPSIVNKLFGDEWDSPGSEVRLKKMADTISTNCKNFKRNDADKYNTAIKDWETDLAWLKKKFYKRSRFPWPDNSID